MGLMLAFEAVCEIAKNHLVKHIVSLGGAWIKILISNGFHPTVDITVRSSKNTVLGRLMKYEISPSALPVVIHLVPNVVKFPTRPSVVNEMRRMLEEAPLEVFERAHLDKGDFIQINKKLYKQLI
ncbi:hypothetical protein P4361_20310 [Fictibacillus sp. B-59209]|uniref:hypothetical protein n=1 Tax=Fictibacillus sp. B-59209 TaxID=3024873 RepID=UPI002E1A0E54|nr:hypothetical protein [Fictibacillus sp. B-59209]